MLPDFVTGPLGMILLLAMLVGGGYLLLQPQLEKSGRRDAMKRRLHVVPQEEKDAKKRVEERRAQEAAIKEKATRTAQEFYLKTDPDNVARIRAKLVRAGYFDPAAVGMFFVMRFVGLVLAFGSVFTFLAIDKGLTVNVWLLSIGAGGIGYFFPGLMVANKAKQRNSEYRNSFPDFMDLMIVCADAGMTMEAAIERVGREMEITSPALSENLKLLTIELRAGRSLEDSLKSLAERLGLDEVRSFATLLQQSRELGTSLAGALRVFSDEMRHKRMSLAEEKAHALPAKMSVPVTVCILPSVMMIATIPVIVGLATG
jgi:tight adherence protein C